MKVLIERDIKLMCCGVECLQTPEKTWYCTNCHSEYSVEFLSDDKVR
jgi:hypothetical protein